MFRTSRLSTIKPGTWFPWVPSVLTLNMSRRTVGVADNEIALLTASLKKAPIMFYSTHTAMKEQDGLNLLPALSFFECLNGVN